jgi:WD40 repeat protein
MLAICEAQVAAHPARVTVLNSATGAIIGTFNPPSNRNIISSSFSPSGKVFAVQCAAPSHVLTFLKVDTRAPIASRHMELHINHISFNPVDDAMLCIAGKNCLKLARRQGKEIHVLPLLRPQYECVYSFTESIWLNSDILAAITTTGQVLLIEEGVLRQVLECCPASMIGYAFLVGILVFSLFI